MSFLDKFYIVKALILSIRKRGLAMTAGMTFYELWYGLKLGRQTFFVVTLEEIDFDEQLKSEAKYYAPTNFYLLRRAFRHLKGYAGTGAFVDIGCGAGRVMMFAMEFGFDPVVGVEASKRLCEVAEQTLERYARSARRRAGWSVVHADARHFPIADDYVVFFLFNPFRAPLMQDVVDNIVRSYRGKPRPIAVVYANPVHAEVFEADALFRLEVEEDDYRIYSLGRSDA